VAIYRMLEGMAFDEQSIIAMTAAYEAILVNSGVPTDPTRSTIVASKIITICQMGECDPERICELALRDIRG
jgi:hypothetical protein